MTPLKLTLEGATDLHNASEEDVERGIAALLSADGPTWMPGMLTGSAATAATTDVGTGGKLSIG